MANTQEDAFYDCLTPPETPPPTTKKFCLPLSILSIYCREFNSAKTSTKPSCTPRYGASSVYSDSTALKSLPLRKDTPYLSSVAEASLVGHMTSSGVIEIPPTTPPSTPPSSYPRLSNSQSSGLEGYLDSSPSSEASPLLSSSSVSTSSPLSESPTPTQNGSINPNRFTTPPSPAPSPKTSQSIVLDTPKSCGSCLQQNTATPRQSSAASIPKPICTICKASNAPKNIPPPPRVFFRKRKVSSFVAEAGPYIPEGITPTIFPKHPDPVVETETIEAGGLIGYGKCAVQLTAREVGHQKRQMIRRKVRYYRQDEIQNVRISGSVSGESESETSSDGEASEKGNGNETSEERDMSEMSVLVKDDTVADKVGKVKLVGLGISFAKQESCG